ncbi:LysR family transcriptional regulator [Achromobacter marplatensis]|uniref:DNA-binding transcriptional LysR family regulator n=1 Tax=Achromobacter marplatensis TaxID=470868 RepID=A0ABX9GMC2_9BURK|nr:LysR family transcriptional regulator [Achromobacter marplatensis]OWT72301.1 LysR family transcriptional regulator [Achromobacter marplatensis]RBP24413.1 DNA-binding transcriptional LysR family regulator [Achromobacter marplatensis]CAB3626789.1 HTH-type transcriptional regulator GltC [Achromobacter marplatensis]
MNLSARQLRAFVALADERHFTRAAQRCHLTQPAFSALIRSLEDAAGLRLFDRNTRHVELTAEGRVLDASARRLLADMDLVMDDLRDHAARRRGRVALAALPSLAAGWLPGLLARFSQAHPGIVLDLRDALLDPCLDMVRSGQVDFAVASRRPDMTDLDSEFLHADRYFLVCRADHPLAAQSQVRLRDIVRYPVIQLARGSSVRKHLDEALGADAPLPVFEVEHLATVTGLVRAGLGVSVVPAMTLFHFRSDDLRVVPLAGRALTRPLYLVQRKGRSLSVAAQALYELLIAHRGDIGGAGHQADS